MERTGDEELMRDMATGSEDALGAIVRRHETGLLGWFGRRLRSREDAEEAAQDVFVRVARGAGGFVTGRRFRPWFFAIARNVLRDRRRLAPPFPTVPLVAEPAAPAATAAGSSAVRAAIRRLPRPYRAALVLRYLAGMSYREAADELGITERGFETRLRRAKGLLRKELADGLRD